MSVVVTGLVAGSLPAAASAQVLSGLLLPAVAHATGLTPVAVDVMAAPRPGESRPGILPALYASSALLQALDVKLTLKALSLGAVELNPAMRAVVKRPAAFMAVKAAAASVTILAAERLWRTGRRKTAVVLMAVTTGVMAVVGLRNASVVRAMR